MSSWVQHALSSAHATRFEAYADFLTHGRHKETTSTALGRLRANLQTVRRVELSPGETLRWMLRLRKGMARQTEASVFEHHRKLLAERDPDIYRLVMGSRTSGGLRYDGQFSQLTELAQLIRDSGCETFLELGSGVSSALFASLVGDARRFTTVEESPEWYARVQDYLRPFQGAATAILAERVVTERDGEPVCHYAIDHSRPFDFVYVDGPSNVVRDLPEPAASRALELDPKSRLANADVELMWAQGCFPKIVVVDGRRSTVGRMMRLDQGRRYDVHLKSKYVLRASGVSASYELYHSVFVLRRNSRNSQSSS